MMARDKKHKKHIHGIRLLTFNLKAFVGFEILYKLLFALLATPFVIMLLNASIRLAGYRYLTNQNLFVYLRKPQTIAIFVLLLLFVLLYVFFEMTALTGGFHASYCREKITATDMFRMGVANLRRVFRPGNLMALVWLALVLPLISIFYFIALSFLTRIPGFVKKELIRILPGLIIAGVVILLLALVAIMYVYCIQDLVIENRTVYKGKEFVRSLVRGKYWKTGAKLLLRNLLFAAAAVAFFQLLMLAIVGITKGLKVANILPVITLKGAATLRNAMLVIYFLSFGIYNAMFITDAYLKQKEQTEDGVPGYEHPKQVGKHPRRLHAIMWYVVLLLGINSLTMMSLNSRRLQLQAQLFRKPVIMAHRGASAACPENTLAAFQKAIDDKADWIELDVQMTKDGVVVCTHDPNLKRVAGVNRTVASMNYEDIRKLDVGKRFAAEYEGEWIPTLEEVLQLTAGKIKLNIEMKPTGREIGFEQAVVDLIYQYGMEYDCMICSMNYQTLKNVKSIAPNIPTTYVLSMIYTNAWNLEAVDAFSIHYLMITPTLVYNIKSAGKDLYAWTINDEETMELMLERGVDGVITDDTLLATRVILGRYAPESIVDMVEEAIDVISEAEEASAEPVTKEE